MREWRACRRERRRVRELCQSLTPSAPIIVTQRRQNPRTRFGSEVAHGAVYSPDRVAHAPADAIADQVAGTSARAAESRARRLSRWFPKQRLSDWTAAMPRGCHAFISTIKHTDALRGALCAAQTKSPTPRPTPRPTDSPTKSPTRRPTPSPTKVRMIDLSNQRISPTVKLFTDHSPRNHQQHYPPCPP